MILGGQARPRSVALAARFADEYNIAFLADDDIRRVRSLLDGACLDAGRDPASLPLSMMTLVAMGADEAESSRRLDEAAKRLPAGHGNAASPGRSTRWRTSCSRYEEAGLTRVYLQHPDRHDLEAVALMGQLAERIS